MIRTLLRYMLTCLLLSCASITSSFAQGTYGASSYFNFTYASVPDWTGFASATSFKKAVDGDTLTFLSCDATGPTRAKGGYTGAIRCQAIELPYLESLGYLSFYIQNGSSGTNRNIYIKTWDEATTTWLTADTIIVGGGIDQRITVSSVLSKRKIKVKIDSDGKYFWFHQLEAWSSKLATTDANEAPKILSVTPLTGTVIPASGKVTVQFDEPIKASTGAITFSGATTSSSFKGSSLIVKYTGLTQATDTLKIPANTIVNNTSINLAKDTSFIFANDVTDPVFVSVSPVDSSKIHISDIVGKIVLTFDENIALGTGTISFGPATVSPTISGKTLVIGYTGLAYKTSYVLTIPANMIKDISGNTYKQMITLHYTTNPRDSIAPVLKSQSLTEGATAVAIGGSLYFNFDEIVQQKSPVTLNGNPVVLSFNGSMVGINYTNLEYSTNYKLEIPAGAITDTCSNGYSGLTLNFTTKDFAAKDFDIIVAKDGSGDFTTVQAAINAVTDNSNQRTFIYLTNGVYNEKVLIPATKQNISLIGQDSAKTIITYNDYAGGAGGTDLSYTIDIKAAGFYAENITVKNTWPTTGGTSNQAVALMTEGDQQVFKNCRAFSFQDTHYPKVANTRNYYTNCFIQGATDFMFGGATAFYEACTINCVNGGQYVTAPSTTTKEFGLVYNNCTITANSNVATQAYYLGRPWKDFAKTVWLNTKMGAHIKDIGWSVWTTTGDDADNQLTGFYAEYKSMNLSGTLISPIRAAWGKQLTDVQAARYTIDNAFNYGSGSNTWNPLPYSTAPEAPKNFTADGGMLSWDAPKYAVGYVVFRNDTVIATTTATHYMETKTTVATDVYKVRAVNEYGAQSEVAGIVSGTNDQSMVEGIVYPNPFSETLNIKNEAATLEFYALEGQLIKRTTAQNTVDTHELKSGTYMLKIIGLDGKTSIHKVVKR